MVIKEAAIVVLLIAIPFLHLRGQALANAMYDRTSAGVPATDRHYWLGGFGGSRYLLWWKYRRMGLPTGPLTAALVCHAASILAILLLLWLMASFVG